MKGSYIGREINGFVVVAVNTERMKDKKNRQPYYIVKCKKCGNLYNVRIDNLKYRGLRCMPCREIERFENM